MEPTQKGWFIKYIDRTPETLARQAVRGEREKEMERVRERLFSLPKAAERKKRMDKDDEEKIQAAIEEQITRALASKKVERERERD